MKKSYLLNYFALLIFNLSLAQTIDATHVEINFHGDSNPQNLTAFQSGFYFTATDGTFADFGRELWYCDGTPEGIQMVKDIYSGQNSSEPEFLVVINDLLYFTADDGVHGTELWKSDGTESGTVMVKDIRPANNDDYNGPTNFINFNGELFFTATDDINGRELWKSDGTESGTLMVKDIRQNGSSSPTNLFVFNNALYFVADNGVDGYELWKSDGTETGTTMVKDINTNSSGVNNINQFLILNDHFYFYGTNGVSGFELWKSDGTDAGTTMVKDIVPGFNSSNFSLKGTVLNNIIIFEASNGSDGLELWKTDGTEAGTTMIRNINGINSSSISNSNNNLYIKFNNEVYFLANDNVNGNEIWKTDGTTVGTTLLKDIRAGNSSITAIKFHVDEINNKLLFFTASTNSSTRTLWVSDGSTNGTIELSSIEDSNISGLEENFISLNNSTVFTGQDPKYGNELWFTDGTINNTAFFADMNFSNSSSPAKFTNVNGELFFRARGTETGNQLFKSDGTFQGTQMVKDINSGNNSIGDDSEMTEINGTLFFSANDGTNGNELWKSDGTENGTVMVKDINIGNQSSMQYSNAVQPITAINDLLYFYANDGVNGTELWRSDGTETGTYMIKDIYTGNSNNSSFPRSFVTLNNIIYFIANDNTGTALWTTDGTESGTVKIINLNDMRVLNTVNNKLIIVAETSGTTYGPHDLWVSDGTVAGTTHIQEFEGGIDSNIRFTTTLNDEFYFVAKIPFFGRKGIYKTDGTIAGTVLLYDGSSHPTINNVDIDDIVTCGNNVYFAVKPYSGFNEELWRTDGVTTTQIADSNTDDFAYIRGFACYNNNLLYLAESPAHNIWAINDNLNAPVHLDINVINGTNLNGSNSIQQIGTSNNNIYFSARNNESGIELYISDIDASTLSTDDYFNAANYDEKKLVQAYPNPANDFVHIKSLTNVNITSFELWDLSGKKLQTYVSKSFERNITYDVKHLNTGIYLVKARLSNGNISNLKLIIN